MFATGINGNQTDNSASGSGAAYVFTRDSVGAWTQQAYLKASNTQTGDRFGIRLSISNDGDTLAISAFDEDSAATGINGNQADNSANESGAVYVFTRDSADTWSQQAYIKASNTETSDEFGQQLALNADGSTLAVGANNESSAAVGINSNQADNSAPNAGAVYVFTRDGTNTWSQQAYIKASNTDANDEFHMVELTDDGNTLAVGAIRESSSATGINGDQTDNNAIGAGALYLFTRSNNSTWSQQSYIKAPNTDAGDSFGIWPALSGDGSVLAIGSVDDSAATGINGDQTDNSATDAGAMYLY